jgi:SAM-dependent methyltransferase
LLEYLGIDPDHYMGLDISPGMLLRFADKFPDYKDRLFLGDMENLDDLVPDSFDIVVSLFGPISHCWDHLKVYRHIHRVLKPGGRVFIQAYSARYPERASYIFNQNISTCPSSPGLPSSPVS